MSFFIARVAVAAVLAGAFVSSGAFASGISVSDAWFRALPAGLPAGGYFKLHNDTSKPIMLKGADSPACGMLMVHRSVHTSGMEHMMPAGDLDVPAGGILVFAPGGYHLMCMNPTPAMKAGAIVTVTLHFANGAAATADFAVRGASGE
jgi:periplasmic copper chaperone A